MVHSKAAGLDRCHVAPHPQVVPPGSLSTIPLGIGIFGNPRDNREHHTTGRPELDSLRMGGRQERSAGMVEQGEPRQIEAENCGRILRKRLLPASRRGKLHTETGN